MRFDSEKFNNKYMASVMKPTMSLCNFSRRFTVYF